MKFEFLAGGADERSDGARLRSVSGDRRGLNRAEQKGSK